MSSSALKIVSNKLIFEKSYILDIYVALISQLAGAVEYTDCISAEG